MKHFKFYLFTFILFGILGFCLTFAETDLSGSGTGLFPVGQSSGWQLTFQDEFDGTALDTAKWSPQDLWCGVRNNELQAYEPANVRVSDGLLHLVAQKEAANYGYCGQSGITKSYASGIVITMDKFDQQYGYFEARAKIPQGKGLWPAFWMMPYHVWPPEIDAMEALGQDPNTIYMTNHWGTSANPQNNGGSFSGVDFSADFHVFGVKWTSTDITWYVDGVQRFHSTSGVPSQPFFMMLNLAVGGSWPVPPDSSTPFPSDYQVDYVRAWKAVSCSDQCAAGAKQCSQTGSYQICGDQNNDGCLEWGSVTACAGGQSCSNGACVSTCVPKTCTILNYGCGNADDGCNNTLNCGTCPADQTCTNNLCVTNCKPKTCSSLNYNCGTVSDGCDGTLNCGICGSAQTCLNGTCVSPTCVPDTCSSLGYECGSVSNGCGNTLNCGACNSGNICSGGTCVADTSQTKPVVKMNRADILVKIAQIQAAIAGLQKQLAALTGTTTFSCAQITKNLFYGMKNDPQAVRCLQEVLKEQGYAVTVSENYDLPTKAAVIQFQQKYAGEILAPFGLKYGSGNVGNTTRAKLNKIISSK